MKVLMLNGSPHTSGNTALALGQMEAIFDQEDIKTEIIHVGNQQVRGCTACYGCAKTGKCVFDDVVNKIAPKFRRASGLVIASPVYYAAPNATLSAVLDRLFFSTQFDKAMKVGAAITVGRRGGLSTAFDQLNKYFMISGMPLLPANTGTVPTVKSPVKCCKMKKVCKLCVRWRVTWPF